MEKSEGEIELMRESIRLKKKNNQRGELPPLTEFDTTPVRWHNYPESFVLIVYKYKSLYFKDNKLTYYPTGIFLENFAQENVEIIFVGNPQIFNPILHKLVMNKLLLMSTIPLKVFNKSYKKGSDKIEKELLNRTVDIWKKYL